MLATCVVMTRPFDHLVVHFGNVAQIACASRGVGDDGGSGGAELRPSQEEDQGLGREGLSVSDILRGARASAARDAPFRFPRATTTDARSDPSGGVRPHPPPPTPPSLTRHRSSPPPHADHLPVRRSASVWDAPPTARWCASWFAVGTSWLPSPTIAPPVSPASRCSTSRSTTSTSTAAAS